MSETKKQVKVNGVWVDATFIRRRPGHIGSWPWYAEWVGAVGPCGGTLSDDDVRDAPHEPQWRAFRTADEVPPLNMIELRIKAEPRVRCTVDGINDVMVSVIGTHIDSRIATYFEEAFARFEARYTCETEWHPFGVLE